MLRLRLAVAAAALLVALAAAADPRAPDTFTLRFETTALPTPAGGSFDVLVNRSDAPHGADRLHLLAAEGFFNDTAFFRVVPGFVVQWGMSGSPNVTAEWANRTIPDDPVLLSNLRGVLSFAADTAPDSRTTQVYVNLGNNSRLDGMRFAGVGTVVGGGMSVFDDVYAGYGEEPDQAKIAAQGNAYLRREFPLLDYAVSAYLL